MADRNINEIPIIEQVILSLSGGLNRMAFLLGSVITGSVPIGTYVIAHQEVQENPWMWIGVFFGALFSLVTVFRWGCVMFRSKVRAVGYCALVEFGMIFSTIDWLSVTLLCIVVFINGISGGCTLVLDYLDSEERKSQAAQVPLLVPGFSVVDEPEQEKLRRGAAPRPK